MVNGFGILWGIALVVWSVILLDRRSRRKDESRDRAA